MFEGRIMMGDCEYGYCDICGKKATLLRKYYYYKIDGITCDCCSSGGKNKGQHFEIVRYCKNCVPEPPMGIKMTFNGKTAEKLLIEPDSLKGDI